VIAEPGQETSVDIRELTLFRVFDPTPVVAERNVILALAGDGAGVAADAAPGIDNHRVLDWSPGGSARGCHEGAGFGDGCGSNGGASGDAHAEPAQKVSA